MSASTPPPKRPPPPPAPNPFTQRTIVESKRYEAELAALGDVKRMDEVLEGFMFTVSWNPKCGKPTDHPKIMGMVVGGYGAASLVVYYSFNDQKVMLESITVAEDGDLNE